MNTIKQMPTEKLLEEFIPQEAVSQLLAEHGSIYEVIMNTTPMELSTVKKLGNHRVRRMQCLRELLIRLQTEKRKQVKTIRRIQEAAAYFSDMERLKQEQVRVLMLNGKNGIIADKMITQGTINASLLSEREIFYSAIRNMAASIIIAHNHPSGDSAPSQQDIDVTKDIVKAGRIIHIPVLDHIIIGKGNFYSFKENNLIE